MDSSTSGNSFIADSYSLEATQNSLWTLFSNWLSSVSLSNSSSLGVVHKVRHVRVGEGILGVTVCDRGGSKSM